MLKFEEYLADFSNTVNIVDFITNLIIATVLSLVIKFFYIEFGRSFSNRERFSAIFVPMALATLLIITVVQASIALSLGLVGALSIVRFRAAIKEPEELTYIFLIIGVGLTCGANKPLLAIVAIFFILPLIYFNSKLDRQKSEKVKGKLVLNVISQVAELDKISEMLASRFSYLELKRFDSSENGLNATFITRAEDVKDLDAIAKEMRTLDPNIKFSMMDQPDLIL